MQDTRDLEVEMTLDDRSPLDNDLLIFTKTAGRRSAITETPGS